MQMNQLRTGEETHISRQKNSSITWGLTWDIKCILRFLVDSNGTTIASYRGRTIRFPEIRPDQINTSHTDNSAGAVVLSAEQSSYSGSCIADTPSKIKAEKLHHR